MVKTNYGFEKRKRELEKKKKKEEKRQAKLDRAAHSREAEPSGDSAEP